MGGLVGVADHDRRGAAVTTDDLLRASLVGVKDHGRRGAAVVRTLQPQHRVVDRRLDVVSK